MSSNTSNMKPASGPKSAHGHGHGGYSGIAPSNQSLLLDKLNVRRSTPDSEALASSDDEVDPHRQDASQPSTQPPQQKPVRRASWLNSTSQTTLPQPRKGSFASSTMSPTASHPSTPAAETTMGGWGHAAHSAVGRTPSFPWGTGIWNNDRSKEPPSRLSEVLPSPTSSMPGGLFGGDGAYGRTSPGPTEQSHPQIPFAIPLHPTPKTYRSQSYSVGQLEPDANAPGVPSSAMMGRGRPMGHPGLQHRPSRPSMLSEMSSEGAMLGKVNEADDDEELSPHATGPSLHHQSAEAKTIELLARENAMLRQQQQQQAQQQQQQQQAQQAHQAQQAQQAQQQQYQNSRLRPRASTAASYGLGNGYSVRDPVPEESDYAIDELDEQHDGHDSASKRNMGRRMSEYGASMYNNRSPLYPVENRKLENVKKAFWQSSLGFGGGVGDLPQSRRHSFADMPTRQGSITSIGEGAPMHEANLPEAVHAQDLGGYHEGVGFNTGGHGELARLNSMDQRLRGATASYFTGGSHMGGAHQAMASSAYGGNPYGAHYGMGPTYGNRAPSPHRSMYGMSQPRHNQLLYIVLFKCSRADVFYIQEGTGLTVKPGDLVIVEADRGTDLGTVDRSEVDWATAKELKEHYAEEHYKWLMMYSQNAAAAQEGTGAGLMAAANGMQGSAIGGMGPPSQHHMQEPNAGELKPKLIKRLAQSHEIHNLREKEGNEAKAKRVCMQKVKEHGLNMEILDAEFQMDWKKLTFYYFADAYINFNSLVTDLFKIYKTRIWMSAINPASFASPTLGLQAPSGIGPGAVGLGRGGGGGGGNGATHNERRPNQQQEQQASFAGGGAGARSFQPAFSQPFGSERSMVANNAYPASAYPYSAYGAFSAAGRSGAMGYGAMMAGMDPYGGAFPSSTDYQSMQARFPSPHGTSSVQDAKSPTAGASSEWLNNFQSLSLNTR